MKPSDLRNDPRWRKTRMVGLSDRDRISMICSAVLIKSRVWQTDGRTDGIGVAYTRYSMLSRVKIVEVTCMNDPISRVIRDLLLGQGVTKLHKATLKEICQPITITKGLSYDFRNIMRYQPPPIQWHMHMWQETYYNLRMKETTFKLV